MRKLESTVERKVAKWAKPNRKRFLFFKLTVPGMRGVPDRICLFPGGRVIFIEFKRPGEEPRKLQVRICERLQAFGFRVYTYDDADECIRMLENELH
jgi:hypothetical protein